MNTDTALRLARAISPQHSRARRFEEWRADVAGCDEVGLSRADIAVGALRLATAARVQLLLSLIARTLVHSWTAAVGVMLGAACTVCDVPVLTVVALALLLQGSTLAVAGRRARTRRLQSRRIETSG
jgi:hypothetical protein